MNNPKPKIYNNDIKVLGRVVSIATENKLAAAEQIFDERFKYSDLDRYSFDNDNIDITQEGLNQYSINRLLGKKVKAIENSGFVPDENGYLYNVKINGLTVQGGANIDNLNVTNNAFVGNDLSVTNKITAKEIEATDKITTKDLYVTNNADIKNLKINGSNIYDIINDILNVPDLVVIAGPTQVGVGESITLHAEVLPTTVINRNVSWLSLDTSKATVNTSGVVTGVSEGNVIIRAISQKKDSVWGEHIVRVGNSSNPEPIVYHTVTINNDGNITTLSIRDGGTITEPTVSRKQGYKFINWTENGSAYNFNTPVTSDITITTHFEKYELELTDDSISLNSPSDTSAAGYNLQIADFNENATERYIWSISSQNVFNQNVTDKRVIDNLVVSEDGYNVNFKALHKGTAVIKCVGVDSGIEKECTITVTHDIKRDIEYRDGDTVLYAQSVEVNTAIPAVVAPTKYGYTFDGWEGMPGTDMPEGDMSKVIVTAKWIHTVYTVTYKDCHPQHNYTVNDTTFEQYAVTLGTQQYHANDIITEMGLVEARAAIKANQDATWNRDNYNLTGWNNIPYGKIMPNRNIVVYAIWEEIENPLSDTYNLIIKPDFTNEPQDDPYWYQTGNTNKLHQGGIGLVTAVLRKKTDNTEESLEDIGVTWRCDRNTVILHQNGDFCTFEDTGSDISNSTTFTISATHPDFLQPSTITITLEPPVKYRLIFDTNGGSPISTAWYKYKETISPVTPPTKKDWYFAGWNDAIPETMPRHDVTVTAQWLDSDVYTIRFDKDSCNIYQTFDPVSINVTQSEEYPERIVWTSSNRNVAIVEPENYGTGKQEGCIYAVGNGTAIIRGTGAISGKYAEVAVTVELLNLSYHKVVVNMDTDNGDNMKELPSATYGVNNTPVSVTEWTSSNENVALVYMSNSPAGVSYKIKPMNPGICYFDARYTYTPTQHTGSAHNNYERVCVIVKQSASSDTEGILVELSPYYASLSNGQSQIITASTLGVNLANDYEWTYNSYPHDMITITPSVGNLSCTVTAGNTPGFAEVWLKPISDNTEMTHLYGPGTIKAGAIIEVQ